MKIMSDYGTVIIPNSIKTAVIINRNKQNNITECLDSFINQRKKSKCIIYDEDEEILDVNNVNYISLSSDISYENNVNLKPKTLMNNEIKCFIEENEKIFASIERIRSVCEELKYDKGICSIKKILNNGIDDVNIDFDITNFDLNVLLQFYSLCNSEYSKEIYQLFIFNMLLYINRNSFNIVHIHENFNDATIQWLKKIKIDNMMVLIDNEAIEKYNEPIDALIMGNGDHLETLHVDENVLIKIPYLFNPVILSNIHFQTQENIELMNLFKDKSSSFLVKNII